MNLGVTKYDNAFKSMIIPLLQCFYFCNSLPAAFKSPIKNETDHIKWKRCLNSVNWRG